MHWTDPCYTAVGWLGRAKGRLSDGKPSSALRAEAQPTAAQQKEPGGVCRRVRGSEGCGGLGDGGGNVRWGQKIDDSKNKAKYRVYMSERTDGSNPNTLLVKDADVLKVPHIPATLPPLRRWSW